MITDNNFGFPDLHNSTYLDVIAVGGSLSVERLLYAYQHGIFPWYEDGQTIMWWSPDPRFVLFPSELKVSKSMKQLFKKQPFKVTYNTSFKAVITQCATIKRKDQEGTWITHDMIAAYCKLHELGHAKSVEVWLNDTLVGGLYGIQLKNKMFCGESMFSKVSNASKYGFISFINDHDFKLIDCQVHTNHLENLGAKNISRDAFLSYL